MSLVEMFMSLLCAGRRGHLAFPMAKGVDRCADDHPAASA